MCFYGKAMLTSYKNLDSVIKQIENLIVKKAKGSFYNLGSTVTLSNELITLGEVRLDLIELKEVIEETLSKINEEDRVLLEYKYFKIIPNIENFDHTSRNYFRKQVKAINRFNLKLQSLGYTEEWFFKKYIKIAFINGAYQKAVSEEGKKHVV